MTEHEELTDLDKIERLQSLLAEYLLRRGQQIDADDVAEYEAAKLAFLAACEEDLGEILEQAKDDWHANKERNW